MRSALTPALLFLLAGAVLQAEVPARKWALDLHRLPVTFEGAFEGKVDGEPIHLDLRKDLNLAKDGTGLGLGIEYQGTRFGWALSTQSQDFKGVAALTESIDINGTTYSAATQVASSLKMASHDLNWTIRAYNWPHAWVGVDLGLHVWDVDLAVTGVGTVTINGLPVTEARTATEQVAIPLPQLGFSVGGQALEHRLVFRASYHFLRGQGASYSRTQADLRYFPLSWLGARVFVDNETIEVPMGSITDDLKIDLDRKGTGFGVVVRF